MSWLDKILPPKIKREDKNASVVPEGLWSKCPSCSATLYATDLAGNHNVCPKCGHHNAMTARERINLLLDENGRDEIGAHVKPTDILKFKDKISPACSKARFLLVTARSRTTLDKGKIRDKRFMTAIIGGNVF